MGKDKHKDKHDETTAQILNTMNPEIFESHPRPGGYIKLNAPSTKRLHSSPAIRTVQCGCPAKRGLIGVGERLSATTVKSAASRKSVSPSGAVFTIPSREFRLNVSILEKETEGGYSTESDSEDQRFEDHPLYKSAHMLAATISCVMMMAAGHNNIPPEYFLWTEKYLECQKNEDDVLPYNINGILNHIQYVKQGYSKDKKSCGGSKCSKGQKPPPDSGARPPPRVSKEESSYHTAASSTSYNPRATESVATNKTDSNKTIKGRGKK